MRVLFRTQIWKYTDDFNQQLMWKFMVTFKKQVCYYSCVIFYNLMISPVYLAFYRVALSRFPHRWNYILIQTWFELRVHCRLGSFFPVSWKFWTLKLESKLLCWTQNSYVLCILKARIWLPSKWHYFNSLLISDVCYRTDILWFSNGFLINFGTTYSLKLVCILVNISCNS